MEANIVKRTGRKRTKASQRLQTTLVPIGKKFKSKPSAATSLKAMNALNHKYYTKEVEHRMKDFASKSIMAYKRISQQALAMYNALGLRNEMECVEMSLYP